MRYLGAQDSGQNLTNEARLPCFMRRWEGCTMYDSNHYTRYRYETQKNHIR